jgi:HlyD family secretion protein
LAVSAVLFVAAVFVVLVLINGTKASRVSVEIGEVTRRDLTATVAGAGRIRARASVDVSAATSGKVVRIGVEEGDHVARGQFLLEIDPTPARERVNELAAALGSARAMLELTRAQAEQLRAEHERQERLFAGGLVSGEVFQKTATALTVQRLQVKTAEQEVARLEAGLRNAEHELGRVDIRSDIDGVVTAIHIAEGENAFLGNFNNPATVLMNVADLSAIEAVVELDETDVVAVAVGQRAVVRPDAFPGRAFGARVVKVGHSPISGASGQSEATRFEVVVAVGDEIPRVRPGLSCDVEIVTASRTGALALPIEALTARSVGDEEAETQGVLLLADQTVQFRPVRLGVSAGRFFEVLDGVSAGERVVTGPFEALRELDGGDRVAVVSRPGAAKRR